VVRKSHKEVLVTFGCNGDVHWAEFSNGLSTELKLTLKSSIKQVWQKTIFNIADRITTPCNVAGGSGIMTVNSPSGSTMMTLHRPHHCQFSERN